MAKMELTEVSTKITRLTSECSAVLEYWLPEPRFRVRNRSSGTGDQLSGRVRNRSSGTGDQLSGRVQRNRSSGTGDQLSEDN